MTDDAQLDKVSRQLLSDVEEVKRLELKKRRAARSSPELHELAKEIERQSRHVFQHAEVEAEIGTTDSPILEERAEQYPGDWTHRRDN